MKDVYGYDIVNINNLKEIKIGTYHYVYKNIDFLLKKNEDDNNLLISFHGTVPQKSQKPVFRCHNYSIDNTSILSIFDNNIKKYESDGLVLSWFLSTQKYDNDVVYREIINNVSQEYKHILFFGTSGGGYPSLKYGSIFKAHVIISNAQIYLDKYFYFKKMNKIIEDNDDKVIYQNIESIMLASLPKSIFLSTNIRDSHSYNIHSLKFQKFCNDIGFNNLTTSFFNKVSTDTHTNPHSLGFASDDNREDIITQYFEYIKEL